MNKLTCLILLILFNFVLGCRKEAVEDLPPSIRILSPTNSNNFNEGDTIRIKVASEDDHRLERIGVTLVNNKNNILFTYNITSSTKSYMVDTIFVVRERTHTTAGIKVEVSDIKGNTSSKNVYFHLNHKDH